MATSGDQKLAVDRLCERVLTSPPKNTSRVPLANRRASVARARVRRRFAARASCILRGR